jgi:hypothetical protein
MDSIIFNDTNYNISHRNDKKDYEKYNDHVLIVMYLIKEMTKQREV